MAAEGRALLEELVSVAAGIMLGAQGQGDHGPARAQTAHAQRAQAGTNARAWSGARVKKETGLVEMERRAWIGSRSSARTQN